MKKKIVCIFVMMLLIASTVFPVVHGLNERQELTDNLTLSENDCGCHETEGVLNDCPPCMISYWKLEDTGDWTADDSIGNNDGAVFSNGDQNEPSWNPGQVGGALWLPGDPDDGGVRISHDSSLDIGEYIDDSGGFALEAWIKYTGPTDSTVEFPCIMSKRGGGSVPTQGFMLGLIYHHPSGTNYDGTLILHLEGINYYPCSTPIDDGQWHHIAVFRYMNEIYFYVDGELDGQTTSTKNPDSNGDLILGYDPKSSHTTIWEGALDEIAIYHWEHLYDRCFFEESVRCHYKCGLNGHDYCGCIKPQVEKQVWNSNTNQWVDHLTVQPGASVRFRITFTNIGDCGNFSRVILEDHLPEGLEYITNSADPPIDFSGPSPHGFWLTWNSDQSTFINGPFEPGQGFDVEFEAEAILPGPDLTITYENCVQASSSGCGLLYIKSDCATVLVTLLTPFLQCIGSLSWYDITPGDTVSSMLEISNVGDNDSKLTWEVTEYPEWGTWNFYPLNGTNLKPEDGPVQVEVEVEVPDEKESEFSGEVKIINIDDPENFEIIPVTLSTTKSKPQIQFLQERFPYLYSLLSSFL